MTGSSFMSFIENRLTFDFELIWLIGLPIWRDIVLDEKYSDGKVPFLFLVLGV